MGCISTDDTSEHRVACRWEKVWGRSTVTMQEGARGGEACQCQRCFSKFLCQFRSSTARKFEKLKNFSSRSTRESLKEFKWSLVLLFECWWFELCGRWVLLWSGARGDGARSCRAPTGSDQSCAEIIGESPVISAQLWSDPVGARHLRAKALRRRAPPAAEKSWMGSHTLM